MNDDGLVINGASLAGVKAAEGARRAGWAGPIRLVGAEPHLPYERPPLTKEILLGDAGPFAALVGPADFNVTEQVDLLLGTPATSVDLGARTVELRGGRTLRYRRLVLATGSSQRQLPIPGVDLTGAHSLRSLDDALAIRDRLLPGRRVAIIGASWIGTEVAACASQRGCRVTMIDPAAVTLERALGAEVGAIFTDLHRRHGVDVRLGVEVEAIEGAGTVTGVRTSTGSVPAEVVVIGVGVTPNVDLARRAGLRSEAGCSSTTRWRPIIQTCSQPAISPRRCTHCSGDASVSSTGRTRSTKG